METCPAITLRRGKIEIKVENAAAIIKKIDEMYPTEKTCSWPSNVNKIKRELSDIERERQKIWMLSARDWFKKEIFGGSEDFEVLVSQPETKPVEEVLVSQNTHVDPCVYQPPTNVTPQQSSPSVNKNAYEIRSDVLCMALDWAKWQTDMSLSIASKTDNERYLLPDHLPNSDKVLEIARKFYSFVENRR